MVPSETGLQPHCEIVFRPMASPQVFKKMIRWVVLLIIPGWHITIHLGPKSHLRRNRSETNEGMRFNHTFHCWPRGANPFAAIAHCTLEKPCCVFKARLISSHSAKPSQHPVVSHELFQKTKAAKQLKYCGPTQKQTGHMDPLKPDDAFFSSAFMPVSPLYLTLRFAQSDATPERQKHAPSAPIPSIQSVVQNTTRLDEDWWRGCHQSDQVFSCRTQGPDVLHIYVRPVLQEVSPGFCLIKQNS